MAQHDIFRFVPVTLLSTCVAACIGFSAVSHAAQKQPAKPAAGVNSLLVKRQYKQALAQLEVLAKKGDAKAQFKLGSMYRLGMGTDANYTKADYWISLAAQNGDADAKKVIARMVESVPATVKKSAAGGGTKAAAPALFDVAKLPPRSADVPDWLVTAAARDQAGAVALLHEANDTLVKSSGNEALDVAAKMGRAKAMAALLEAGAKPNTPDTNQATPTMLAASVADTGALKTLLGATPDLALRNKAGLSALNFAARSCNASAIALLLEAGATPQVQEGSAVEAVSTVAVDVVRNCGDGTAFIPFLRSMDLDTGDARGRTAAWYAATLGDSRLLKAILAAGANSGIADKDGFSPLHAAALTGQLHAVMLLVAQGKETNPRSNTGITPLMLAAYAGCAECVSSLAATTNDIDQKSDDGETALMYALRGAHLEIAKLLVEKGANAKSRSINGDTPEKLAGRLGGEYAALVAGK